jgi:DNA-binding NtrC family response regulator
MNKKQILVVEDDEDIRTAICTILGMTFPGQILEAEEGGQAIKRIYHEDTNIAVIVTDINMPNGMGGFELLEILRQKSNPALKIIISGYTKNSEDVSLMKLCDYFFEKPVDLKIIVKIIEKQFSGVGEER